MFSWSKARPTSAYPASRTSNTVVAQAIQGTVRPPSYTRSQHLESFVNDVTLKRSTRRVSSDDCTYDTVFQTVGGEALILRTHLPPASANGSGSCPSMTLVGVRASHSWLDHRMRITGFAPIQSDEAWRTSRVLLGAAVHEVVKHLQLNPPTVLEVTDDSLRKVRESFGRGGNAAAPAAAGHAPQHNSATRSTDPAPPNYDTLIASLPGVEMPPLPTVFPSLDELTREQMQEMLDDNLALIAFVNVLPTMQTFQTMATSSVEENAKMAQKHLDEEESYSTLHQQVTELQKTLKEKVENFRELEKQQSELCVEPDARDLVKKFSRAKKEALDDSEEYADEWVENGGEDVSQFIKKFMQKRRMHHERAAKMEILQCHGHQ